MIDSNKVPGTFVGSVEGPGLIQQIPGIQAGALGFPSDGYINYGRDHEQTCFHLPQLCVHGVTFTMWLWLESYRNAARNIIINNSDFGGHTPGYRIRYLPHKGKTLRIQIRNGAQTYLHDIRVETEIWMHVAFTLGSRGYLESFINGCPAKNSHGRNVSDNGRRHNFTLGGIGSALMKIDNILVWYKSLTAQQIWRTYV